jgi:hypothetical protein
MRGLVIGGGRGGGRDRGRFLDNQMDIGSAYARGIDPGDGRFGAARPRPNSALTKNGLSSRPSFGFAVLK